MIHWLPCIYRMQAIKFTVAQYSSAFQTFGPAGKLSVEISMIGFLMGTAIAFFVVMGDLAPPIVADFAGVESSERLRLVILVGQHAQRDKMLALWYYA